MIWRNGIETNREEIKTKQIAECYAVELQLYNMSYNVTHLVF